jgi:hypothetical protein
LLLARTFDERNPHVIAALRNLAFTLPEPFTAQRGRYFLDPSEQQRVEYALDSGPVVIESETAGVQIIAALRDAWYDGRRWTSYAQLMGLPANLLSDTYYFPSYNNVTVDGQLRFGIP